MISTSELKMDPVIEDIITTLTYLVFSSHPEHGFLSIGSRVSEICRNHIKMGYGECE